MSPAISVVTPTRNRRELLLEAVASIQRQTLTNWEHLVIDDGSEDGTADALGRLAAADSRIRYVRPVTERSGANACRNLGIRESRASLIVFLDSDDLLEPDSLARRVAVMNRNADLDFVTFQAGVFLRVPGDLGRRLDDELIGDDLLRFLYFEYPWQTSSPTWRRATLERLGGFDESLPSWQDIDLHIRAIASGCRYVRFPTVDHHMRWQFEETKTSILQRRSPDHLESAGQLLEKFERVLREGPGMDWRRLRALCSLYFLVAEQWVTIGRLAEGLRLWASIRRRQLGPRTLHVVGAALLTMEATKVPLANRLTHKWKGWMRLRQNPELVPQ